MYAQMDVLPYLMGIYWVGVIVALAVFAMFFNGMWRKVSIRANNSDVRLHPTANEIIGKVAFTFVSLLLLVWGAAYAHSLTLETLKSAPAQQNQALLEKLDEIQQHQEAQPEALVEQKEKILREQEKPYDKAITSFQEKMAKEAQKVRDRNPKLQGK